MFSDIIKISYEVHGNHKESVGKMISGFGGLIFTLYGHLATFWNKNVNGSVVYRSFRILTFFQQKIIKFSLPPPQVTDFEVKPCTFWGPSPWGGGVWWRLPTRAARIPEGASRAPPFFGFYFILFTFSRPWSGPGRGPSRGTRTPKCGQDAAVTWHSARNDGPKCTHRLDHP